MKVVRIVCCFCLLLVGILAIFQPITVLAQEPLEEGEERVRMEATYPKVEGIAGASFEFEVTITYTSYHGEGGGRTFDLVTTGPKDWYIYMTPKYEKEKMIAGITLTSLLTPKEVIRVVAMSPPWLLPEPGEYPITLEAVSSEELRGEVNCTMELKAVITARYILSLVPATERYSTTVTAGKDNYFSMEIWNDGSAAIDNITFSSDKPEGWTIEFSPDKVDSLVAGASQTIDAAIKPPSRTIAGDYAVFIRAEGKQASARELDIRVTVETSTVWGWVGVGIIVVVVAGIAFVFRRFSRR